MLSDSQQPLVTTYFTTASPKNFEYVTRLVASQAFGYRSPTLIKDIMHALKHKTLAGALAIGNNGAESCITILAKCKGRTFVAMESVPWLETLPEGSGQNLAIFFLILSVLWWQISIWFRSKVTGVATKFYVGDPLQHNEVSRVLYAEYSPQALAEGSHAAAPEPLVVGHGLDSMQTAFDVQKKGVSARKVVVTL